MGRCSYVTLDGLTLLYDSYIGSGSYAPHAWAGGGYVGSVYMGCYTEGGLGFGYEALVCVAC